MNETLEGYIPTPEISTPSDIFDASVRAQKGERVDVSDLIPIGKDEDEEESFRADMQRGLDWVAETTSSPEFAQFEQEVAETLAGVEGQHFIFDIEGTLMINVPNLSELNNAQKEAYYVNPYMQAVVTRLIENGNSVGFWTSAYNESLEDMRKAMSPETAELPAIGRDDWEKVAEAFRSRQLGELEDNQVLEVMQSVYPTANEETFRVGTEIFTEDTLESFDSNPTKFLITNKYPQLFLSPESGFFVDDDNGLIESATSKGWPECRAIRYNQRNVIETANAISSEAVA